MEKWNLNTVTRTQTWEHDGYFAKAAVTKARHGCWVLSRM